MARISEHQDPRPDDEYYELEPKASSLCRYYHCLPKWMQEDPSIKNTYLGLEYCMPEMTMEEKEQMLNQACLYVLPLDNSNSLFNYRF